MNNKTKKYLITESIQIDFQIEANSAEEARDAYFEHFEKMFTGSKITCENSSEMSCYEITEEGEYKKDTSI